MDASKVTRGIAALARRSTNPDAYVELHVRQADVAPLYRALAGMLEDKGTEGDARSGIISIACQLHQHLPRS